MVGCRCEKRKGIIGAEIMDGQVLRISKRGGLLAHLAYKCRYP